MLRSSLALIILLAWTVVARAQAPETPTAEAQSEYFKLVGTAIEEFDAQRYAEARALFLRAHEIWPSARTWRTLGMTAYELRMYPQAEAELQASIDDPRRPLDDNQRSQVAALLDRTRAYVGRYALNVTPAETEVFVDGARIASPAQTILLAVGPHDVRARAPGYFELRLQLNVQGREKQELQLTLIPEPRAVASTAAAGVAPPPPEAPQPIAPVARRRDLRVYTWSSAGVGAAGVVMAAAFGGIAIRDKNQLNDNCPMQRCGSAHFDDLEHAKRMANVSTAGIVIGAVGLATAATLWWLDRRHDDHAQLRTPFRF